MERRTPTDQSEDNTSSASTTNEEPKSSAESLKSQEKEVPPHLAEKAEAIRRACGLGDLDALVSYASSEGGFLQDELRQLACKCGSIRNMWYLK